MRCRRACTLAALCLAVTLLAPGAADAAGARYSFDGGTPAQRDQVRAALQASTFDWSVIPGTVTVHIRRGIAPSATPGHVWLDAGLLDAGRFSWAVVQHEYAHQLDYLVLSDSDRTLLQGLLGGRAWCLGIESLAHDDNACERFATSVSWAYWPSPANAFDPARAGDEPWLQPAALRLLLSRMLGVRDPYPDRAALGAPLPPSRLLQQ